MLVPPGISPRKLQITIRPRLSSTTMSISFLTCRWYPGSSNYSVNLLRPMRVLFHLISRLSIFRHFWQFKHSLIGDCMLVARLQETCSLKSLLQRKRITTSRHCLTLPDRLTTRCKVKYVQHWETQTKRKFIIPWLMRYSIYLSFPFLFFGINIENTGPKYVKLHQGKLVKMEESANKLLKLVFTNDFENGVHIDFYDI